MGICQWPTIMTFFSRHIILCFKSEIQSLTKCITVIQCTGLLARNVRPSWSRLLQLRTLILSTVSYQHSREKLAVINETITWGFIIYFSMLKTSLHIKIQELMLSLGFKLKSPFNFLLSFLSSNNLIWNMTHDWLSIVRWQEIYSHMTLLSTERYTMSSCKTHLMWMLLAVNAQQCQNHLWQLGSVHNSLLLSIATKLPHYFKFNL